ncbi:cell division protein FtsW [Acidithiobacillus thiooxidans]|uniref:Probable peptidoglycan glycosyltransferase FtsW n=1 Tax=Acidithiobacillus thiooxidans TaxID=930 RepID=A0A1C2IGZ9_ACITH|nr:putative lipid II flippase FtsW [Acidithiobacillus thiooxidans]OCX72274.1 cell division protein FtsW [Acidithiobacillus thiooxidans]OCX73493.1 cell division protein FtsW [Acidithiobacillus thiooxidans]OCX75219.1 cell division protein FtsW [Acidithiobacillus thiooxidans]OCX80771.1 cell division protein FtsW [Acidithiobacillus thiooxidans]OCX82494.1 cell division protein FtsW [Acidithiobacillus thiooxidans]
MKRPSWWLAENGPADTILWWIILVLLGFGLIMVYSASAPIAQHETGNPFFFAERQGLFVVLAAAVLYYFSRIDLDFWERITFPLMGISLIALVMVFLPVIGVSVNGSHRWINFLIVRLQPSELLKFALLLFLARYVVRKGELLGKIKEGLWPIFVVLILLVVLLMLQPDFGSSAMVVLLAGVILFLGGLPIRYVLMAGISAGVGMGILAVSAPYRLARITSFQNPWADPYGSGFQLVQSLIAFGRGGIFGVGLGDGIMKYFYLPESYTDFILAVIGEELGMIGVWALAIFYSVACWRIYRIGRRAAAAGDAFFALFCYGTLTWFGSEAVMSMGVNLGALPTKGFALPLISYGGSALVFLCAALGVVLAVSRRYPVLSAQQTDLIKKEAQHG